MSIGKTVIAAGFAVPFAFIVSTQAFSAENGEAANEASESQALLTAKIGLADAIKAAEEDSKGKAVESSFTAESGTPGYQVEVVTSDGARSSVFVDAMTGKVIKMASAVESESAGQDEQDQNTENEQNDENEEEGSN